jgi:hypothetical protein
MGRKIDRNTEKRRRSMENQNEAVAPTIAIRKILFPIDLTENASRLLPYVFSLSEKYKSRIYLLHVVQDLNKWGKLYVPHPSMDTFQKEAIEAAKNALETLCEEQLQRFPDLNTIVVSGDAAQEILKAIASEGIDLVINSLMMIRVNQRGVVAVVGNTVMTLSYP